jgi:catechol 2,3-dioxygenase-like lactoylglutathione lyase family enzyme
LSFGSSLAFHHIALSVTDMDRATWFYSEVLGLEKIERPPFDFGGAWYQLGDHTLHLIVHPPTRRCGTRWRSARAKGTWRCACATVRSDRPPAAHGIKVLDLPDNLTPWAQVYCCDPDGNVIEFNVERGS